MNVKNGLKISMGVVGTLVLLLVLVFLFWLGPTIKLVAQTIGSKVLGTPLTIDRLSINPLKGTVHLSDFAVANHQSYGKSNAVSLASVDIAIDMGSVFTKTVIVNQVQINNPYFIYEQSTASNNIAEFIQNVQEFVGIGAYAPPEKKKPKKEKKPKKQKKQKEPTIVIVESLEINDVQFHLANTDDGQLDIGVGFERLSVSMTNGTVQLDNVYAGNPGRLSTPNLFTLDQVKILVEPGSIYSSNITIHAVQITNPQAYIEHNPEADTVAEFLKIANSIVAQIPTNSVKASATNTLEISTTEGEEPPPPEVALNSLVIEGVRLHVVNIGDPQLNVHFGIDKLNAALDAGNISVENIHITNPKRLATPNLFSLESILVKLAPESLKADTLVIEDIQILKPHAFLELNKEANTVGEFMKIANGFIERVPTYPIPISGAELKPEAGKPSDTDSPASPPFELHNLLVDDIQVKLLDTTSTNTVPTDPHMLAGIAEISVKLVDGKLQVNGITIPNVEGFTASNMFHLASIDISVDPASIHSEQVVINEVFINSPEVNLEQTEESGNVAELQATLMKLVPPATAKPATGEGQTAQTDGTEPEREPVPLAEQPVVLHQLLVTNLAINLKFPVSTNAPSGVMGMVDIGKLNPMDKLSIGKLNPLSGGDDSEEDDPYAPMTLVAFDILSIEPLKGLLYINGLRISNPPGFSKRNLVKMDEFRIDLDPDSLQTDTLVIEDILISRPRIRYERQIMSDNIKALQKEIEQATTRRDEYTGKGKEEPGETKAVAKSPEETGEDEGQKVIIEHLLIANGLVRAKLSALPAVPVPLPNIELKDIGKEKGGASAAEASTQIFDTFYDSMIGAVGDTTGFAGDALKGIGSFGMDALGNVTGSVVDKTETAVEDVKKKRKKRRGAGGRRRLF